MSGKKVEDLPVENTGTPDPNLGQICSGWGPTSTASHVELEVAMKARNANASDSFQRGSRD